MVRVAGTLLLCLALTETSEQVIAKISESWNGQLYLKID